MVTLYPAEITMTVKASEPFIEDLRVHKIDALTRAPNLTQRPSSISRHTNIDAPPASRAGRSSLAPAAGALAKLALQVSIDGSWRQMAASEDLWGGSQASVRSIRYAQGGPAGGIRGRCYPEEIARTFLPGSTSLGHGAKRLSIAQGARHHEA
jgi:hypothetical protein